MRFSESLRNRRGLGVLGSRRILDGWRQYRWLFHRSLCFDGTAKLMVITRPSCLSARNWIGHRKRSRRILYDRTEQSVSTRTSERYELPHPLASGGNHVDPDIWHGNHDLVAV